MELEFLLKLHKWCNFFKKNHFFPQFLGIDCGTIWLVHGVYVGPWTMLVIIYYNSLCVCYNLLVFALFFIANMMSAWIIETCFKFSWVNWTWLCCMVWAKLSKLRKKTLFVNFGSHFIKSANTKCIQVYIYNVENQEIN